MESSSSARFRLDVVKYSFKEEGTDACGIGSRSIVVAQEISFARKSACANASAGKTKMMLRRLSPLVRCNVESSGRKERREPCSVWMSSEMHRGSDCWKVGPVECLGRHPRKVVCEA